MEFHLSRYGSALRKNTSLGAKWALTHHLQNPKWPPGAPKWPMGSGVYPWVFWRSKQLLLNKFFDPRTPSMRKGRDRGEKTGKKQGEKRKD